MTREGKIGVAIRRWPLAPRLLFIVAFLSFCGAGRAAAGDSASVGVACQVGAPFWEPPAATAEDLPWASVWLGHFSGGRHFKDGNGQTFIDWRDEKSAFPRAKIVKPGSPACAAPITGRKAIGPVYFCVEWRGCVWRLGTL